MNSRFPQDLPIPEKFLESQKYSVNLYKKKYVQVPREICYTSTGERCDNYNKQLADSYPVRC